MATEDAEYIGVSELAAAVGEELSEIAESDRRMKSGATEIPTERTIRFYLEKGLLPKPSKRLGQTLVFGRIHLLHLLVIKKLQADGIPLSAIPDILRKKGKTEEQLEDLLVEDVQIFSRRRSLEDSSDLTGHARVSFAEFGAPQQFYQEAPEPPSAENQPPASSAKSYLKSLLSRAPRRSPESTQRGASTSEGEIAFSRMAAPQPEQWTRHEPAPGLEINISQTYEPPADEQGKAKLLETLRKILGL